MQLEGILKNLQDTPGLTNVGTPGLLTDCVQLELPELGLDVGVVVAAWHNPLQPVWLAGLLL